LSLTKSYLFLLLSLACVAISGVYFLIRTNQDDDLTNKITLSTRQKSTTLELADMLREFSDKSEGNENIKQEIDEIEVIRKKWSNAQKAFVNGSDLFKISTSKSEESNSIVNQLSPIYIRIGDQLHNLSLENVNSNAELERNLRPSLKQYAELVNDLSLQWVKEQERERQVSFIVLFMLVGITCVLIVVGFLLLIRPYIKWAKLANKDSDAMALRLESERKQKIQLMEDLNLQLRTPLSAIIGTAELMAKSEMDPRQQESVRSVLSSASSIINVLDDLVDHSAIENGLIQMQKTRFNLHENMEQVLELIKPLLKNQRTTVSFYVGQGVPAWIHQDEKRIRQVLLNILGDVIKSDSNASLVCSVELIHQTEELAQLKYCLSGVDVEIADQYSKLQRTTEGVTALGRELTARIIFDLGGRVWSETGKDGRGVICFTVIGEVSTLQNLRQDRDLTGIKALVIDEDKTNLKVLIRQLSTWGIQSTPFNSLDLVEEIMASVLKFDLCIMNVDQEGGEGIKMAERLVQLSGNKLPVIALTSKGGSLVQTNSKLLTTFLTRPVKQIRLFETIARVLDVSETELMKVKPGKSADPYALNVIIAQDNDLHRAVAERTLQLLGHKCENAFNMDELQDKLSNKHYDLIIVGADEKKWNSFSLTGRVSKLNSKEETVVIGIAQETVNKRDEFDDLLTGKFTGDILEEKIKAWFEFE